MAEILLTAAINKSALIVGDLLVQHGARLYWLKEDIEWLQREMRHIRSYIDEAKDKAIGGDSRVKNLLKDIQELAGDVEDLLDEFLPKIQQFNKCKSAICCITTACIPCASPAYVFGLEIEKIKRRVADIDRVRTTYNITGETEVIGRIPLEQRRSFLRADETEVIGLDNDFKMLRAKLLDQGLPYGVVSIVGMPGLGKTTLAKKLYRHVCGQFECSGLVYVSQQPRAGEILDDIAKQVGLTEQERKDDLDGNLTSLLKTKRNIVERCGGIPLAIVVTAGMLRARERTERAWSRVLKSMGQEIQDGCAKVLAESYNDLPIELRPYFLYFGLYPEDHEIRAFDLTNMWIAEKLIVVNSDNRGEAEDSTEDFLTDLVSRNLIQVAKRTYDGRISSCRIHDLLHSLCVQLAKESNFFHTEQNAFSDPVNIARVRRITFYSDNNVMNEFFRLNPTLKKLRALFCFTKDPLIISQMAHLDFKLLQVLVVEVPRIYGRYVGIYY